MEIRHFLAENIGTMSIIERNSWFLKNKHYINEKSEKNKNLENWFLELMNCFTKLDEKFNIFVKKHQNGGEK